MLTNIRTTKKNSFWLGHPRGDFIVEFFLLPFCSYSLLLIQIEPRNDVVKLTDCTRNDYNGLKGL